MNAPTFVWLVALPLIASPVIYLIGRLMGRSAALDEREQRSGRVARLAALVALIIDWLFFAAVVQQGDSPTTLTVGTINFRMDGVGLLLAGLALALGTLVVLFSGPYMGKEVGQEKYYAMLLALLGAMMGLGCAADVFNLWVWFEAMAVCSYLLVMFYREQPTSLEAGVKYLIQSAVGSALILLGIALVLAQTHTLSLDGIREAALPSTAPSAGLLAAGALFLIGFGVKAALVPLHTWLPDAHAQAPSGISALLSGVVIEAGLIALLRTLPALTGLGLSWGLVLMVAGALNMFVGNLMALRQTTIKRLLAYSSLSQVGYILLGLGIGLYAGQIVGAQGGFFHLLNHGLMKGLAFLSVGALLFALHLAHSDHQPLTIQELSGAAHRYPLVALSLSIAVLGLAGLPPLAGFMSKWQIFIAGFSTHDGLIDAFVIFAAFNSILSLGYYIPLLNVVYRQKPSDAVEHGAALPIALRVPLVVLALAVVLIGVWPTVLDWLTTPASRALLGR